MGTDPMFARYVLTRYSLGTHCILTNTTLRMNNQETNPRKPMTEEEEKEHELAKALERYTNPMSPEYDADFHAEIRAIRPDWFDDDPNVQAKA